MYRIPESNMPHLAARIAKMNKRAAKLNMPPIVLTETGEDFDLLVSSRSDEGPRWLPVKRLDGESTQAAQVRYLASLHPEFAKDRTFRLRRCILCTVEGSLPRVDGWAMVATIQHDDAGNILRTVPGLDINLPVHYRTATTFCEHCKTDRRRNDTYVLQSDVDGWKQVGRNCLADFIRSTDVSAWADAAEMLAGLDAECRLYEGDGEGGSRATLYFRAVDLLAQVAACVRNDGFCSRTESKNSMQPKQATADHALCFFDSKWVAKLPEKDCTAYAVTPDDTAAAEAAISWAQELPADVGNDYLWNIRVISHRENLTAREAGLAASIIAAHLRHLEQELKRRYERETTLDEHFGEVGKRGEFSLTVTGLRSLEGSYGLTTLVKFRDAAGRVACWFASGDPGLDIGSQYCVKATVKAHEVYQGMRQTGLTRVQVVANLTAMGDCLEGQHVEYNGHCVVCGEILEVNVAVGLLGVAIENKTQTAIAQ